MLLLTKGRHSSFLTECAFKMYNELCPINHLGKKRKGETMKKLFRGLFTTALAVGFLAGCKPTTSSSQPPVSSGSSQVTTSEEVVKHLVEFYEDNVGKFYLDVEVPHGTKVTQPADPAARVNYEFAGWWVDEEYSAEFDFDTLIIEDTTIFGKWEFAPEYVPDTRDFHIVGALNNTDVDYVNWADAGEVGVNWDVRSYLTKAEDSNLYSLEIEIGYLGKFKIKIPGRPWDSDLEFNFENIKEEDKNEFIQEGDLRNIQVTDSGLYKIEIETTWLWARVTRLGDALGDGVRHNTGETPSVGIVGSQTNWGNPVDPENAESVIPDIALTYDEGGAYYYLPVVFLELGEFKLRADNSWSSTVNFASHANNEVPAGIKQGVVGETEEIDEGANLTVITAGYYSVYFKENKLVIHDLSFVLRGNALETNWGADSAPLALLTSVADEEAGTDVLTFEGTFAMVAGEFKVKLAALAAFDGWSLSFGPEAGGNFLIAEAGNYVVTLVLTIDVATLAVTGVVTFAPAVPV